MSRRKAVILLVVAAVVCVGLVLYAMAPRTGSFHRSVADRSPNIAKPLVMSFDEVTRSRRTSVVRTTFTSGTSVASSLWVMGCNLELAEARQAKFFIELRSWRGADGSTYSLVGFSDARHPDPASYFGDDHTTKQLLTYFSVDELRRTFGRSSR